MTIEIGILLFLLLATILAWFFEVYPPDTIAMTLAVVLMLFGFVSPAEGIAGLSNQATVSVLALMILSVGLETTGVITALGKRIKSLLGYKDWMTIALLMLMVAFCSAFISTTAVVIVFLRIMIKLTKKMDTSLSKVLMPLSFAGILGGSCTLLGTSTNLLVSSMAKGHDLAPFGVFEFSHIGIIFFFAALAYMLLIGRHLVPDNESGNDDLTETYDLKGYLTEVVVDENSPLKGKRIDELDILKEQDIDLIAVKRQGEDEHFPSEVETLQENDRLLLKGAVESIANLRKSNHFSLFRNQSVKDDDRLNTEDMTLCEVIFRPNAHIMGQTLDKGQFKRDYDAVPLAIKKNKDYVQENLDEIVIESGDTVLVGVGRSNFERFYNRSDLIVLQEHEDLALKSSKRYLAMLIVLGVIAFAAAGVVPIVVSALAGCVAMFLTGCMTFQRAYRRVDWSVFFLLAGVIPIGTAMDNTGASDWLANGFVHLFGESSPRFLVSMLFIFTALLSGVISNNATAILLTPIALAIAQQLGLDPRPLLVTVMFAANTSYMSPIGYQTNTLIYGPGGYHFTDFLKVGGGLTLLIWALATLLIPIFYF